MTHNLKEHQIMQRFIHRLFVLAFAVALCIGSGSREAEQATYEEADVVVYGGSSAGVIAAVQAKRMGKTAVIVNPYSFLGGMTSSELNSADVGNPAAVSGLARDFFMSMGKVYGKEFTEAFEPHVAEAAFEAFVADA